MGIRHHIIRATIASAIALTTLGIANPANAALDDAWLQCIVVSDANLNGSSYSKTYEIAIKNGCSEDPDSLFESVRWEFRTGRSSFDSKSGSTYFPGRFSSRDIDVDISRLAPGTYRPTIRFSTPFGSSFEAVTRDLPGFTIAAPEPTPDPFAPTLPDSLGSIDSDTSSSQGEVTTCYQPKGERKTCDYGWTWFYDTCFSEITSARLQKSRGGQWVTVRSGVAKRSSTCENGYPVRVKFSRTEANYGTHKYRVYFPASARYTAGYEYITVTVR